VAAISIERGVVILTAGLARLGAAPSRQRISRTRSTYPGGRRRTPRTASRV